MFMYCAEVSDSRLATGSCKHIISNNLLCISNQCLNNYCKHIRIIRIFNDIEFKEYYY